MELYISLLDAGLMTAVALITIIIVYLTIQNRYERDVKKITYSISTQTPAPPTIKHGTSQTPSSPNVVLMSSQTPAPPTTEHNSTQTTPPASIEVIDQSNVILHNHQRILRKATLKFVIQGSSIEQVNQRSASFWQWRMTDGSSAELRAIQVMDTCTEFSFVWHRSANEKVDEDKNGIDNREVCFDCGHNDAVWFPTYMHQKETNWPMDKKFIKERFAFNVPHKFEIVVEHLLFNSDGFALLLDRRSPLFMRYTISPVTGNSLLCISVNDVLPYQPNGADLDPEYSQLRFRLYASTDIRSVYQLVANQLQIIPRPRNIPDEQMFFNPILSLFRTIQMRFNENYFFTQSKVLEFVKMLRQNQIEKCTLILLRWGNYNDRLQVYPERYPNMKGLVDTLHQEYGCKVYLFIVEDNANKTEFSVKGKNDKPKRFTIDHTNSNAVTYFRSKLEQLRSQYGIDSFCFFSNLCYFYSSYSYNDSTAQKYPRLYRNKRANFAEKFGNDTITCITGHSQNVVSFHFNKHWYACWQEFSKIIARALTKSIAGYSFIISDSFFHFFASRELYIRWMQAATFMPVMHFLQPPSYYDEETIEIVAKLVSLHRHYAPTIVKLAKERVQNGAPIIRPMWYVEPNDALAYEHSADQFALGNDLVVAPVLKRYTRQRTLYLPTGEWIDQHGGVHCGPVVMTVKAPLNELPYFVRVK